jgi:dynein heavy chain
LDEANDIKKYLTPLTTHVDRLNSGGDFVELFKVIPGLLHSIVLISQNSKYYNTAARLTLLLREVANDVIGQARNFIGPTELFGTEPEEALEKIRMATRLCDYFKEFFHVCHLKTKEKTAPWTFDGSIIFTRFDAFIGRLNMIANLFDTIIEFNKIEKIEIGNTKVSLE